MEELVPQSIDVQKHSNMYIRNANSTAIKCCYYSNSLKCCGAMLSTPTGHTEHNVLITMFEG